MSMRWMNLETQLSVPSFYFLLFILNKAEIVISVCFLNYPCNKKYLKNKSSPNALKFKYDFFWNIWEYLALRTHQGEQAPGHEGGGCALPPGRAPCLVGPWWLPSTYPSYHTLLLPPTNTTNQLKPESKLILLPFSISLLEAPFTKLLWGIVLWYVTPPMVQLVFVLVLYSLQFFAA